MGWAALGCIYEVVERRSGTKRDLVLSLGFQGANGPPIIHIGSYQGL